MSTESKPRRRPTRSRHAHSCGNCRQTTRQEELPNPHTVTVIEVCAECDAKNQEYLQKSLVWTQSYDDGSPAPYVDRDRPGDELDFSEQATFRRSMVEDWAWM